MATEKKLINCLALDGGGIRGILELVYLQHIEEKTGKPIHQIFHTVAGTSTGGLIALLLTVPNKNGKVASATEALKIYRSLASQIFFSERMFSLGLLLKYFLFALALIIGLPYYVNFKDYFPYLDLLYGGLIISAIGAFTIICYYISKPIYSPKGLEKFCENYFGSEINLKDAKTNVGIVATDLEKERPFVFNSMRASIDCHCSLHNACIARIARATSAAPSYFPPVRFDVKFKGNQERLEDKMSPWWDPRNKCSTYDREKMIFEDGGTKANNPSYLCLELAKWKLIREGENADNYNIRLLSLGTGVPKETKKPTKSWLSNWYDPYTPDGGLDNVLVRLLGANVFNVTTNSQNVHVDVSLLYKVYNKSHNYLRVQFEIDEHQLNNMDDISDFNIAGLTVVAQKAITQTWSETEKFLNPSKADVEKNQPGQAQEPYLKEKLLRKISHKHEPNLQGSLIKKID